MMVHTGGNENSFSGAFMGNKSINNISGRHSCIISTTTSMYMFIRCVIILLVVSGNTLILYKIYKKMKKKNLDILIMYLSIFDLIAMVSLIAEVYDNLTCYRRWLIGDFGCQSVLSFYYVSLNMSVCILIIMSVDRCRSIATPLREKFTKKSIHVVVCILIIFLVIIQYYQIMNSSIANGKCTIGKHRLTYVIPHIAIICARDIGFIAVFSITFIWIFNSLNDVSLKKCRRRQIRRKKCVAKMLFMMQVVFTLLVLPFDVFDCVMVVLNAHDKSWNIK